MTLYTLARLTFSAVVGLMGLASVCIAIGALV